MDNKLKNILDRLNAALEKQVETGFNIRHPNLHSKLKEKIKKLEAGFEYEIYDYKKEFENNTDLFRTTDCSKNVFYNVASGICNNQKWNKISKSEKTSVEYFKNSKGDVVLNTFE